MTFASLSQSDIVEPTVFAPLRATLGDGSRFTPAQAADILADLPISERDLEPWTDFDHPVADCYGRQMICRGANYELMLMSWAPGDYSAIHDHGVAEWGAVRYFGVADHYVFSSAGGTLGIQRHERTNDGMINQVDHHLIHLMGNSGSTPMLSLHLYGREESADAVTGNARIFDLFERTIQRTDGGVFFCLPETEIRSREQGPAADPATLRLHHELMLKRLERRRDAGETDAGLVNRILALRAELNACEVFPLQ